MTDDTQLNPPDLNPQSSANTSADIYQSILDKYAQDLASSAPNNNPPATPTTPESISPPFSSVTTLPESPLNLEEMAPVLPPLASPEFPTNSLSSDTVSTPSSIPSSLPAEPVTPSSLDSTTNFDNSAPLALEPKTDLNTPLPMPEPLVPPAPPLASDSGSVFTPPAPPVDIRPELQSTLPRVNPFIKAFFFLSLLIFIGILVALGVVVYQAKKGPVGSQNNPPALVSPEVTPTLKPSESCQVNDKSYSIGQTFTAADGCNTCTCLEDLTISCTQKDCTSPTTTSDSSNWPSFRDEKLSITFQYPPEWKYLVVPSSDYEMDPGVMLSSTGSFPPPNTGAMSDILISVLDKDPSSEWDGQYFDNYKKDNLTIGGVNAVRVTGIFKDPPIKADVAFVNYKNRHYQIRNNNTEDVKSSETYSKILNSIKFL